MQSLNLVVTLHAWRTQHLRSFDRLDSVLPDSRGYPLADCPPLSPFRHAAAIFAFVLR